MFKKWWLVRVVGGTCMWYPARLTTIFGIPLSTMFFEVKGPYPDLTTLLNALVDITKEEDESANRQ